MFVFQLDKLIKKFFEIFLFKRVFFKKLYLPLRRFKCLSNLIIYKTMKKLVLFLAVATAVAFASCGSKAEEEAATEEVAPVEEVVEAPAEEVVADSTVVEAPVEEVVAE